MVVGVVWPMGTKAVGAHTITLAERVAGFVAVGTG